MISGDQVQFAPLFILYSLSVAFFMPTIALVNSVSYNAMAKEGMDPVKEFPPIRVFGTVGFICSMLLTNFLHIGGVAMQDSYTQLISSGILSSDLNGSEIVAIPLDSQECMTLGYIYPKGLPLSAMSKRYLELLKNYVADYSQKL